MEIKKNYINGKWVDGTLGKTIDVINPATGEVFAKVSESSVEDVRRAVEAARDFRTCCSSYDVSNGRRGGRACQSDGLRSGGSGIYCGYYTGTQSDQRDQGRNHLDQLLQSDIQ